MFLRSALIVPVASLLGCSSSSPGVADAAAHHDAMAGHDAGPSLDTGGPQDTGFDAGMDVMQYPDGQCAALGCGVEAGAFTADAGSTWTALYRDYFGTSGVASCAGTAGNCHGQTDAPGYGASGYLCPPGDKDACYTGFTAQGSTGPDIITPDAGYDASAIPGLLCTCDGPGQMPDGCCYIFQPADMARIAAWVNAGSQNN